MGKGERARRDHLTHLLTSRIVAKIDLGIVAPVFAQTIPCDAFSYEDTYSTHTYFAKFYAEHEIYLNVNYNLGEI